MILMSSRSTTMPPKVITAATTTALALTVAVAALISREFDGALPISYSGGVSVHNAAALLATTYGKSFLPRFNEGTLTVFINAPLGTSLGESERLGRARRSRVYTFVDVGYFEFSVREGDTIDGTLSRRRGDQLGYGLGLMTAARAGQINLAVGFPGSVDFATAKLHVSLLGSF